MVPVDTSQWSLPGPTDAARILVVDDDEALRDLLVRALTAEGFHTVSAATGIAAVRMVKDHEPDAVVLDIMLPDMLGVDVMRQMRARSPKLPVVLLTARDSVADRVAGLTAGGDFYLTKPCSLDELIARLRALLRRTAPAASGDGVLEVGDLLLDENSHAVTRDGEQIHLTATEFKLLRFLMGNPRQVLSKTQILDHVWPHEVGDQGDNLVQIYVSYLRRKIDNGREPMIHTLRGAGYILKPAGCAIRRPAPPSGRPDGRESEPSAVEAGWLEAPRAAPSPGR